jgi:hypothetical protein
MAKARKARKARKKTKMLAGGRRPHGIIRKTGSDDITTPDFQLAPDAIPGIAQVIVNLWTDQNLFNAVTARTAQGQATTNARIAATNAINAAQPTYNFTQCVIISEAEHDDGYRVQSPDDVVFVLPNPGRINPAGASLLNSAKLLMACTPNGI